MTDTESVPVARGRERTRALLLESAAEVFAEVGLDAASVEAITERAGFTRGAFYSNFESKDELLLALTEQVAAEKIEQVAERVRALEASGEKLEPLALVQRILDVAIDRRIGVLLTSEIRTRAMRDTRLGATYLAWQRGMVDRVAAVISDLGRVYGLRPRLPERDFARVILQLWEDTAAYSVIAGLDFDAMCTLVNERTALVAAALVDEVQPDEVQPGVGQPGVG